MRKLVYALVIAGSFIVLFAVGQAWRLKPETKTSRILHKGDAAVLATPAGDQVWLANKKDDCYPIQAAVVEKNEEFLKACADNQTAFPVAAGTRVRILAESVSRRQVQILEGPLEGRTGWVEHEFLKPDPAGRR
ncbi:MAG: hypothetical protein KatS3mg005_2210 [Bryobacteraceae bacterium]|nr:MAG: hypothetical protein KatS3mg005_2210 [Bryobacteraceae bacterium]